MNEILKHLPTCKNLKETKCSWKSLNAVLNDYTDIKPCVKLEYKGKETTYHDKPKGKMSKYILLFSNPPKVNVREKYLIYDGVTLISATRCHLSGLIQQIGSYLVTTTKGKTRI